MEKEIEIYKPYDREYTIEKINDRSFLNIKNVRLELNENGYIPKSGLIYDNILNKENCKNKNVLDLGCGYLGIIGMLAYLNGAQNVDLVDIDLDALKWLKKLINDNKMNLNCFYSNFFSNINNTYDMIISNPPILPMKKGKIHDSGGLDGKKYLLEILEKSFNYLNKDGELYLTAFDYLGIDKSYNNEKCLFEIAEQMGYNKFDISYSVDKIIKKGSETYNNLDYIKSIYPKYKFEENDKLKCKIKILKLGR